MATTLDCVGTTGNPGLCTAHRYVAVSDISLALAANVAYSYTRAALKALSRMPQNASARIRSKVEQYAQDPRSQANNVKQLKGRNAIRLRVGNWRVIMDDRGHVLAILDIGPRGGIYT